MLTTLFIGLREGLEAALIVGMLAAYLVRTNRRDRLVALRWGVAGALGLSLVAGAALTFGPRELSDEATDAVGGILGIVAGGLVTWMVFWMARTARDLRRRLESAVGHAAWIGSTAVALVAFFAVGREGLETALLLWAGTNAGASGLASLVGAIVGLGAAIVLGWLVYRGAVRIDLARFFRWTGAVLVVVAAGLVSHGVHELQEAGVVPGGGTILFDVSGHVSPDSLVGALLTGLFGFSPETTALEGIAWVVFLVPVLVAFVRTAWPLRNARAGAEAAAKDADAASALAFTASARHATN